AADAAALRQSWQPLITEAFSRGRRLPEHGR
ncbi:MAG: hypothetical protein QOH30_574, partial [Baekduia sp.]|nr:hypothetical protein [Baekduia sp.]